MGTPLAGVNVEQLIGTGAVLAASTAALYQLKSMPKLIYTKVKQRIIYTVRVYQYDELFEMLETWLQKYHARLYRDVEAATKNIDLVATKMLERTEGQQTKELKSDKDIIYKQEDNTFIIRYGGKKILIQKNKEKLDKAHNLRDVYFRKYVLSGIRAKKQIDSLLREAMELCRKEEEANIITIYSNTSYGDWSNIGKRKIKPLYNTILNPYKKKEIISDVEKFIVSEGWYRDVHVPYKRGYCLYGPPGTGKTTLALAIANHIKRDVFCLNLNCIENDSKLPYAFSGISDNSILLIEDIDKVFAGRESVKEDSKITFSSLLNCLDGAFYKQGLITIITTNYIDKLDEALLRTGRMDIKMEIPKPGNNEISEYLSIFYNEDISVEGKFDITMSDVQEACISNRYDSIGATRKIKSYEVSED